MVHRLYNTLVQKLERFLRTDIQYLLHGSFWLSSGKIISAGVAFILSILYARYVTRDAYGTYRFILSLFSLAGVFALPGMGSAITRSVARGFDGTFIAGVRHIFRASLGIACVGFIASGYFFYNGSGTLGWSFAIGSIFVPFTEGLGGWRAYYDGLKEFRTKTILTSAFQILAAAVMGGTVFAIASGSVPAPLAPLALVSGYFLANGLLNIIFYRYTRQRISRTAAVEPGAISQGYHFSIGGALSTVATYLDGVLLFSFLGAEALAVYSFAIALPEQLKAFLTTVADVGFPKLAHKTQNDAFKKEFSRRIVRSLLLSGGVVAAYIVAAPFLYKTFFPLYQTSSTYSQVFALSLILFPLGIFGTALKAEGNIKKIYIQTGVTSLAQIALLIVLIPPFGLWGAVGARIIGRVINHCISAYLFLGNADPSTEA